ncbi:MAG TPA: 23S rRNA (adenine(2503)-C(2))-methyltransferase RlmN [bacterium]|nr:23S rRNA (adenine(2503)-C(2))-methyltransferase RlmN [bacterium]HOL34638.1 23S rRNA (adenine(2503)-C(2))-methyltransferase RlmN [bacterium]HPP08184.1 23S rRNA (adenine(2503)-C(2))-methyltransferase RlmN [bacterium]
MKENIRNFDISQIEQIVLSMGEPRYRAIQVFRWLYQKGAETFTEMSDVPEKLRYNLGQKYTAKFLEPVQTLISKDGTKKFIFKLYDNNFIESVMIPEKDRNTVCISTQVGCKYNCVFCASGKLGFVRNLEVAEILGQLLYIRFKENIKISNAVFMGMGEPFDNYDALIKAIRIINARDGVNIGARKITVSTAGIVPKIMEFADMGWQVRLSISLHASDDATRSLLMPVNRKYPLSDLLDACNYYVSRTGRRITIEYILIDGINDAEKHLYGLGKISKRFRADVNVIPLSKIRNSSFSPPSTEKINWFINSLKKMGIRATLRDSRGSDIDAACGQLAGARSCACG